MPNNLQKIKLENQKLVLWGKHIDSKWFEGSPRWMAAKAQLVHTYQFLTF